MNPATRQQIPVWVADYVLISYGTGARSEALRALVPPDMAPYCLDTPPEETRRRAAAYLGSVAAAYRAWISASRSAFSSSPAPASRRWADC